MSRYSVVIVGPRGSGKTVFLGSMFSKLCLPGDYGFYLEAQAAQRRRLLALYRAVATGEEWPRATVDVQEWRFECKVHSRASHYTAFGISYYDYSGGRITDLDYEDPGFQRVLDGADCLLGLLDGQKLAGYMVGRDNGFQNPDLANMLPILNHGYGPIHFLVSKWDLLEGNHTLEQIRDKLLENDHFRSLVESRSRNRIPVRLIPVSSVGMGFARQRPDGRMEKLGRSPRPYQVEIPMALILPDKIEAEIQRVIREISDRQSEDVAVKPVYTTLERAGAHASSVINVARELLPDNFKYVEGILRELARRAGKGAEESRDAAAAQTRQRSAELASMLEAVHDEKSALEFALGQFDRLRRQLDYTFPASRIELPV